MTNRDFILLSLGLTLIAGGLFALSFPVFLDAYDYWGWQIKCGTGFGSDLVQAQAAAQFGTANAVDQCESALAFRRAWTISLIVLGWLILAAMLLGRLQRNSAHDNGSGSAVDAGPAEW